MGGTTENLCAVLNGPKNLEIQSRPLSDEPLGEDEVLIEVVSTGICGSDAHSWEVGQANPIILGHESTGVILEIGSGVTDRHVGERVAIEPRQSCMKCYFCLRGEPTTCVSVRHCAVPPTDGTLCQYYRCSSRRAIPIGDTIPWIEAGCIQPLAVAVQLARRAGLRAHQTVAIFGCGPLGLLSMAVAKAYGASKIIAFDIEQSRVDFAVKHFANSGVLCPRTDSDYAMNSAQEFITSSLKGQGVDLGVDVSIEASGAEAPLWWALYGLKPQGTYVQAGLQWKPPRVPMLWVTAKELKIRGTVSFGPGCFEESIDLLTRKAVDVSPMITAIYPLSKSQEAFEAQFRRKDIKIIIMSRPE